MIVYKLKCSKDHEFEGWFKNMKSFEKQRRSKLVICPVCASADVKNVITSTPAIKSRGANVESKSTKKIDMTYALMRKMSEKVRKGFENVKEKFPEEARKIHYGEIPPKNIYGFTNEKEEEALKEEGIEFFKFLMLKETDD